MVIGIEPELAEAFGVSLARVGELISLFSVAYAVCTPVLAIATGRLRRFTLLVAYVLVFVLANAAMAFAPSFGGCSPRACFWAWSRARCSRWA